MQNLVLVLIPQGSTLRPLLFLLYIKDIVNSSEKLSFRLFADDTNVFASSKNLKDLETLMNKELSKVKNWCDANKLSINFKKTNFMIIKSAQKKLNTEPKIVIPNDGAYYTLEKKDHVKYLGVILDDKINWKYHVSFISSKISRNIGIFYKLCHYLSPTQLRQIYYNLIFPYLSYAIIAWGSTYKSNIKILQTKQNHIARVIFFNVSSLLYMEKILKVLYHF